MESKENSPSPIEDLKYFVAEFFDGSVQRCMELDALLWEVRLSKHHEPQMLYYELPSPRPRSDSPPTLEDL
jgi:hypothetical protein